MGHELSPGANLDALAEAIDVLVFVTEPTGRMLWTNAAFVRQTGFRAEDFWFENPENPFIHPEDLGHVGAALAAFVASDAERSEPITNRFFDKWGGVHTYRSVVTKIRWEGKASLLICTRQADPAESRAGLIDESYRQIVEGANDGIVKVSRDGQFHFSNAKFRELVGLDPVALKKTSLFALVVDELRELASASIHAVADGGGCITFESRLVHASEEPRWVSVNASKLTEGGNAGLVLALVRDVSESRRMEEGLRQAQKLESLGVLAGGVAHDFNNLATVIFANAGLAVKLAPQGTRLAEILRDLHDAGRRAGDLSRSLLAYLGQAPTRREPVNLSELLRGDARLLRSLIDKTLMLGLDPGPAGIVVRGDASQISQVLLNLVINGAEAIGDGGGDLDVTVREVALHPGDTSDWAPAAPRPGRYGAIRVRDTGKGMSSAVRARIFDPFYSTKSIGRGLGLSVLLGVVRSHGGAVRIESELGAGSTFEVLFPLDTTLTASASVPNVPRATPSPGGCLLFVDDEPSLRNLGKAILEEIGFEVLVAADAHAALEIFDADADRFRVAVVDHRMPGMRGDVLLERLRRKRPDLPAVHTSGFVDQERRPVPERTLFLPKPYAAEDLQQAVLRVLTSAFLPPG